MAQATRTETWNLPMGAIYQTIVDYASYPEFVKGIDQVEVLQNDEEGARVEYALNLIKKITYTLKLTHCPPGRVDWELESGSLFKQNRGSWELADLGGGQTSVTYRVEIQIKGFFPRSIAQQLTHKSLPSMMESFRKRAEENNTAN